MVCLKLDLSNVEKGQGLWVFNNSLLEDHDFIKNIKLVISESLSCPLYQSEILIWWDNLKYKLKKSAIYFSCKKSKKEKSDYFQLQRKLRIEYEKLSKFPNHSLDIIHSLEKDLEEFERRKCEGAILRSKVQWSLESDRNTAFFLNLEKCKQESNCIKEIKTCNGLTRKTEDIIDHIHSFYAKLYSCEDVYPDIQDDILDNITKFLSDDDKQSLEVGISSKDLTEALQGMKRKKSPGKDGLTVEFYCKFWDVLCPIFMDIVNQIFSQKEMSRSMKCGVISLFYKKRGDKCDIKNFRPISLLNVDAKLISRSLSSKLAKVMPSIISPEQTCSVPGRDIADNIIAIRDVIDIVDDRNEEGYLIAVDMEKAFDRVSHQFIFKVLEKMNFGPNFISWISILYTGLKSCVKVNGHLSPYFPISRSVRQGDPLSSLLYVIVSEPLNAIIKCNNEISGINISPKCTSLLYQHADDITITVSNKESVSSVFNTIDHFCHATGGKVNYNKSEVLCIGRANQTDVDLDLPVLIKNDCVKILGVFLGPDKKLCDKNNWKTKISKIKSLLGLWSQRHLSLQGKSLILNTFIFSRLWYLVNVQYVPVWAQQEIETCVSKFLWNGKTPLIKKSSIIAKFDKGGLFIPDFKHKIYAFRLKFVKKLFDDSFQSLWKHTCCLFFAKYYDIGLHLNVFSITYDKHALCNINPFYAEVLSAWDEITCRKRAPVVTHVDVMQQPLFFNPHVLFQSKVVYFSFFVDAGIVTVADICFEYVPGFLSYSSIVDIVREKRPDVSNSVIKDAYCIIRKSLPDDWIEIVNSSSSSATDKVNIDIIIPREDGDLFVKDCSVKFSYSYFLETLVKEPTSYNFWAEFAIDIDWQKVWANVNDKDKSSEQCELDFKICHNIIFTHEKLYKFGMAVSDLCPVCKQDKEDMFHLFAFCDELNDTILILKSIFTDVYKDTGYSLNSFISWLMFGFQPERKTNVQHCIDIILSIYRISVFKRRTIASLQNCNLNLVKLFKCYIKRHFKLLWAHYKFRNLSHKFIQKYVMPFNFFSIDNDHICFSYPFED